MSPGYKHGFDGLAPEFRLKRGSEVRDPMTGAVIREAEMGTENINVDRVGWLAARGVIDGCHLAAARKLQADAETAEIRSRSSMEGMGGCRSVHGLSDSQLDAMQRCADARESVRIALGRGGMLGETVLRLVVLENHTLQKAAKIMREDHRAVSVGLRYALDGLARHYGLA